MKSDDHQSGPGTFNTETIMFKIENDHKSIFNRDKRVTMNLNGSLNPGPADYNPIEKLNFNLRLLKQSFNKDRKIITIPDVQEGPGPGKYKTPSLLSDKSFKFSKRKMKEYNTDIPGPGKYNLNNPY
mmetsp:Transcript_1496/g.1279  ORF Transcript_1496/g.1279 Transcript_1496/m.1279 type:complete len:127 (-) Transcript_1496:555-935(-)